MTVDPVLLTIEETAQALTIGRTTTYQRVGTHDLPVIRIGRAVRIPVAAVHRWVEEQHRLARHDR
jgi:excisionase family DNA binding protein